MNSFSFNDNLDLLKNTQLEASAGTGKTYSIERIVTLLIARSSLNISRILIVTFTKKAARELRERIREILSLTIHSGILDLGETKLQLSNEERENLRISYLEFEKASIFTIHSFCLNMLKAYPFESMSQFAMEMESESDLTEEAVWDYLREMGQSMSRGQLLKYKAFLEGRTFNDALIHLTNAVNKELLEPDVQLIPDQDLMDEVLDSIMDFNNKKGELYGKWLSLHHHLPQEDDLNNLGFARIKDKIKKIRIIGSLKPDGDFVSINKVLCGEKIIETLVKFLPENLEKNLKKAADPHSVQNDPFVQSVEDFINIYLYDSNKPASNLYSRTLKAAFLFEAYGKIRENLSRKKDITGKLDFNDLIGKLHRALCGNDRFRQPQLIKEIQKRYRTVLVDEFQDTDSRQWEIFNTLFGQDDRHNYFLVGDPKQSIYGFRGADLEIYYKACRGKSVQYRYTLDRNYRSVSSLVESVNILFSLVFRKDMHCGATAVTPFQPVLPGKNDELRLGDKRPSLEFIRVESLFDPQKEISKVKQSKEQYFRLAAYKIYDLLQSQVQLKNQPLQPGDIAILTESNKDCQNIQNMLTAYSIPSVITAREKIFETEEAGEFLIFLQALVRMDNSSIKLLLLTFFFEFSPSEIEELELNGSLDLFSGHIYRWREAVDKGLIIEVCSELFNFSGFDRDVLPFEQRLLTRKNGERSYTNVRQVLEYLHREQHSSRLDAEELYSHFLGRISRPSGGEEDLLRLDKDSAAVQIMTMHASKGLEFPVVFFAGAMKTDVKSSFNEMYNYVEKGDRYYDFLKMEKNRIGQSMDLWEERKRLYYVALTRASSKLYLPYIQNCDYSYLSSFYSAFSIEDINSFMTDNPDVLSYSLPLHSGITAKSGKSGDLKKKILSIIDDSVKKLTEDHKDFLYINYDLENEYLKLGNRGDLSFGENRTKIELIPHLLKDPNGCSLRFRRISSYSSIIRDKAVTSHDTAFSNDADRDDIQEIAAEPQSEEVLTRGAVFGELVHLLLEQLDYSKVKSDSLEEFLFDEDVELLFKSLAVRFFNNKWYIRFSVQLKRLIYNTLINEVFPGFSLCRLSDRDKLHEMEFHMIVKDCNNLKLDSFKGKVEEGFLKGYMDLLFRAEGRVYIADWKTTSSPEGDHFEAFHQERLNELMESHHYSLQSMIYMVALCKYLMVSEGDSFDYDRHFGGCYYLFVRGMSGREGDRFGVHFYRPEKEKLMQFAHQFTSLELKL
ncbi:MAG: UvrD-helicase domain-containing protein [Spirochaetaceae bacterium]|nr:UvrD-helicase domain-containing protein [Spirochaetaceae bacterium]